MAEVDDGGLRHHVAQNHNAKSPTFLSDDREIRMARAPCQVLVLPYYRTDKATEYAIFRRTDAGYWQGIAGGGEDEETPLPAAKREAQEETSIPAASLYPLV